MIAQIQGRLLSKSPPWVLVDTGALTYEVEVPMSTIYVLPDPGADIALWTHFLVREDAQLLFGFATCEERQWFRLLLKVSGVGGRLAIAILSRFSVSAFQEILDTQDVQALRTIPGVGPKMAGRLLLELRGVTLLSTDQPTESRGELTGALSALGYTDKEIHKALAHVVPTETLSEQIRHALSYLSRVS